MSGDAELVAGIRASIADAVSRLADAGARDEALAAFVPPRRVLFFTRAASFVPLGKVWRLGVFLLDRDGTLYETASTTRAVEPGFPGYQSQSAEERRGYRAAALKGPFAHGETINFNAVVIETDAEGLRSASGPLFVRGNQALVRWSPTATMATAFSAYLNERVNLQIDPPEGA